MVKILECKIPQVCSLSKYWWAKSSNYDHGQNIGFCIPIFWPWSYLGDLAFQYFDHELACGIYLSNILTMSIPGGFSSPIFWPWSYLGDLAFQYFDHELACGIYLSNILTMSIPGGFSSHIGKLNTPGMLMIKILESKIPQVCSWSTYWWANSSRYDHGQNIGELNPPGMLMVKILER
jgi:hypothetical protein